MAKTIQQCLTALITKICTKTNNTKHFITFSELQTDVSSKVITDTMSDSDYNTLAGQLETAYPINSDGTD